MQRWTHNFVLIENSESEIPNKEIGIGHSDLYPEPPESETQKSHCVVFYLFHAPKEMNKKLQNVPICIAESPKSLRIPMSSMPKNDNENFHQII